MTNVYNFFEIVGTIAFAISGATTAIRKEMDLLGVIVLGLVTAFGGGMLRDVIGNKEPAILNSPVTILIACGTSFFIFLLFYINMDLTKTKYFNWVFNISDSLGLAVFTIFGCQKMMPDYSVGVSVFFGVLTGVGGGLLRDIIAGQTPYVLSKHFYASSCIIGAIIFVILLPYNSAISILAGLATVFISRMLAIRFKWNLPKIRIQNSNE